MKKTNQKQQRNKLRQGINKEERKEKRIAHEDGCMMNDHATRSVVAPR